MRVLVLPSQPARDSSTAWASAPGASTEADTKSHAARIMPSIPESTFRVPPANPIPSDGIGEDDGRGLQPAFLARGRAGVVAPVADDEAAAARAGHRPRVHRG